MKHMLSSALIAGFAAGLLCALLQFLLVEPKILLAERYESGELVHFQGVAAEASHDHSADHAMAGMDMPATEATDHDHGGGHDHGAGEETSPTQRHLLTVLTTVLTYCGYGLLLVAGLQLAGGLGITLGTAHGLLWGIAGFMAFSLMPALGLEPELPGTPSADLDARQIWWVVTAICTVIGLWFVAYGTAPWQRILGLVVLVAPHVWGAPEPEGFGGVVPPELASAFAARSLAVALVSWAVLGALTLKFWHQEPAK